MIGAYFLLLAQTPDPGRDLGAVLEALFTAIGAKNYPLALSLGVILAVFLVRKLPIPALQTGRAGALLSLAFAAAGTIAEALLSGTAFGWLLLVKALVTAAVASGIFSLGKHIAEKPQGAAALATIRTLTPVLILTILWGAPVRAEHEDTEGMGQPDGGASAPAYPGEAGIRNDPLMFPTDAPTIAPVVGGILEIPTRNPERTASVIVQSGVFMNEPAWAVLNEGVKADVDTIKRLNEALAESQLRTWLVTGAAVILTGALVLKFILHPPRDALGLLQAQRNEWIRDSVETLPRYRER